MIWTILRNFSELSSLAEFMYASIRDFWVKKRFPFNTNVILAWKGLLDLARLYKYLYDEFFTFNCPSSCLKDWLRKNITLIFFIVKFIKNWLRKYTKTKFGHYDDLHHVSHLKIICIVLIWYTCLLIKNRYVNSSDSFPSTFYISTQIFHCSGFSNSYKHFLKYNDDALFNKIKWSRNEKKEVWVIPFEIV